MLHPSELEAALRAVGRSIGVCAVVERRALTAGERSRARIRRAGLERLATRFREAILQEEEPAADRWDLRRLVSPEAGEPVDQ